MSFMDAEKAIAMPEYLGGFAELSHLIGSSSEFAIFRKFETLAARNLLYLQAQLLALEAELSRHDERDLEKIKHNHDDWHDVHAAAKDWASFGRCSDRHTAQQDEKMRLVLNVRSVMREYQDALIRHNQILQLPTPNQYSLDLLRDWFTANIPFTSNGQTVLNDGKDLLSVRPSIDQDLLSRAMQAIFGCLFITRKPIPKSWGDIYFYDEKKVAKLVSIVSVLIATGLLFGAICCLSFIRPSTLGRRIARIGSFTVAFAVAVGIFTDAKRSELYTAVAGYSAVLVVFATIGENG